MRFDFTEQQCELQSLARQILTTEITPSYLRDRQRHDGVDRHLLTRLGKSGLLGIAVSEQHGGTGLTSIDSALIVEEIGRVVAPDAIVNTVAVVAPTIDELGSEQQRERWLPSIVAGDALVTVKSEGSPYGLEVASADALLLQQDAQLHLVPRDRVRHSRQTSLDAGRHLYRIEAATVDESTLLPGSSHASVQRFLDRATVATALQLNGLNQRLLELTLNHVVERHQFGRQIGSFQAVKHRLADAATAVTMARPAAWFAAYGVVHDVPDRSIAASVASSSASDAQREINYTALQLYGGIGYTAECDLQFWLKRGQALERANGSARWHRDRIADWLFDATPERPMVSL